MHFLDLGGFRIDLILLVTVAYLIIIHHKLLPNNYRIFRRIRRPSKCKKPPLKIGVVSYNWYKSHILIFTWRFFYMKNALGRKNKEHAKVFYLTSSIAHFRLISWFSRPNFLANFPTLCTILHFVLPIYTLHYRILHFALWVSYLHVRLKQIKFAFSAFNWH